MNTLAQLGCLLMLCPPIAAQLCQGDVEFAAAGGAPLDDFGAAVDHDGVLAVVGEPGDDGVVVGGGRAWIYALDDGTVIATLGPTIGDVGAEFGSAVAVDGDHVVVGAPGASPLGDASGEARLFTAAGAFVKRLAAGDGQAGARHGQVVDVRDGLALVGAPDWTLGGDTQGAAYLYDLGAPAPSETARLAPFGPVTQDAGFGWSVAVADGWALVGAPYDDTDGLRGSVFVFDVSDPADPVPALRLRPDAPDGSVARFGTSVAVSGDLAMVGSPIENVGDVVGAAYLFDLTTGARLARFAPDVPLAGDQFGHDVDLDGSLAIVGMPFHSEPAAENAQTGAVFVFDVTEPEDPRLVTWITPDEPVAAGWRLGDAVALRGAVAVIGAQGQIGIGEAFATLLPPRGFSPAGAGHSGFFNPYRLTGEGDLMPDSPVSLTFANAPAGLTTVLVAGLERLDVPFKGGVLVPRPDLLVAGLVTDETSGWTLESTWPTGIPADVSTYWQVWVPGVFEPTGFGSSNGLIATTPCP